MPILHATNQPQFAAQLRAILADAYSRPHSVDIAVGCFHLPTYGVDNKAAAGYIRCQAHNLSDSDPGPTPTTTLTLSPTPTRTSAIARLLRC